MDGALIGRTLDGRYAVRARVAQGGMATVYQAWDNRLDRLVALKVIDPELADHPEYVERFIREAKAAARLSHPNIVAVYDQSALPGQPRRHHAPAQPPLAYLAMEYVPGATLRQLLGRRGRLSPREALEILDAMLAGLAAAHHAGIVHRDVKPENVLLSSDALSQHQAYAAAVKVTDFGLARSFAPGQPGTGLSASIGNNTPGGGLIGTVSYLAPELVQFGTCDARSDVYSAGIVLFELLTGRKPFVGGTPLQIAQRHVNERVPPPSFLVPGLDPALDALVSAACAREPANRPADAAAMRAQVRAVYANLSDAALDLGAPAGLDHPTIALGPVIPDHTRVDSSVPFPVEQATARLDHTLVSPTPPPGLVMPRKSPREPYTPVGAARRGPSKGMIILAVILLIAVAVGVGAWLYAEVEFVRAPNVSNLSSSQAMASVKKDGLNYVVVKQYSTDVAAGDVISSSPGAGTPVHKGTTITLDVSRGPEIIAVPDVSGLSQSDATSKLQSAGFKVAVASQQVSSTSVAPGSVVSYSPNGTSAEGSTITLTVSNGPPMVTVPNVVGMSVEDATTALQAAGFTVTTTRILPFVDTVGRQSPGAQSSAAYGSQVTLYIY